MQSNYITAAIIYEGIYIGVLLGDILGNGINKVMHNLVSAPNDWETNQAKEEIPDIFEKVAHLRDDILFYVASEKIGFATAYRNHFGSTPFFIVGKETAETLDEDALHWIYKHEIAHIYYNDQLNVSLIGILAKTITALVLYRLQSMVPWWISAPLLCLPSLVDLCASYIFSCYAERRADDFAIKHATDEELMGGRCFFQSIIEGNKEFRNMDIHSEIEKEKEKLDLSKKRWWMIDIDLDWNPHPPYIERIKTIEREMCRRGIDVVTLDDDDDDYIQAKHKGIQCVLKLLTRACKLNLKKSELDTSKLDAEIDELIEKFGHPCEV